MLAGGIQPKFQHIMTKPAGGIADLLRMWEEDQKLEEEVSIAAFKDAHLNACFTPVTRTTLISEMTPLIGQT